jgi:hypothetical protein
MSEVMERYSCFVHRMWIENCDERQEWALKRYTKEEYTSANGQFLEDSFWLNEYKDKLWESGNESKT